MIAGVQCAPAACWHSTGSAQCGVASMRRDPSHPVCEVILCEQCLQETLRDQAVILETGDGTHYFCSPGCRDGWLQDQAPEPPAG